MKIIGTRPEMIGAGVPARPGRAVAVLREVFGYFVVMLLHAIPIAIGVAVFALLMHVCGCAAIEKLATAENANGARTTIRRVCADIAEADRLAGVILDDAGPGDAAP